jgi:glutamate/tyrosine decarboxylase-like PLP-dependent enzyme
VAQALFRAAEADPELEPVTQALSITTLRYVPRDLRADLESTHVAEYLNKLNTEILNRIQRGGEAFLTNAVVHGRFLLRACVVNFRSGAADARAVAAIVVRVGREADHEMRPSQMPREGTPVHSET